MVPLVAGFVLLWIGSTLLRQFLRASPAVMAARMKQGAGVVLLGFALLMLVRGRIDLALGFGGLGFLARERSHREPLEHASAARDPRARSAAACRGSAPRRSRWNSIIRPAS